MSKTIVASLVLILAFQSTAWAQEKDLAKAQEAFKAAKAAHDKGDFRESIRKLKDAYVYYPDPMIRVSIARRWLDLDEPEEALEELEQIDTSKRKVRRQVEIEFKKIKAVLAQLVPLIIESDPPGAMVSINGAEPKKSPLKVNIERGLIKLKVTREGFRTVQEAILVKGTRVFKKIVKMKRQMALLIVQVTGGDDLVAESLEVTLDGRSISHPAPQKVRPGKHRVTCGEKGEDSNTVQIVAPAGKTIVVQCALPGSQSDLLPWKTTAAWSSLGVGGAALLAGVTLFVSYAADVEEYEEPRYSVSSSKPVFGGIAVGVGAGLIGLGTYWLMAD